MDFERLVIADPAGNMTALVFDQTLPEDMRAVGSIIQDEFPSVEQVLFVQHKNGIVHGQMAGGEFCANAVLALGYVLANGTLSTHRLTISGLSTPVSVHVSAGRAKLEMQTFIRQESIILHNAPVPIVHLEGISHAVLFPDHPLFSELKTLALRLDGKYYVKKVLSELSLTTMPACGLLFAERGNNQICLTPYIFINKVETLYAERACASGSIAIAHILNKNASIVQPSGKIVDVTLWHKGNIAIATVESPVAIRWDGPMTDLGGSLFPIRKTKRASF